MGRDIIMEKIIGNLNKYKSSTPSKWRDDAKKRRENRRWLSYSQEITMLLHDKMEELGLTQTALAQRMNCTQQYISRILKGKENLSLETIARLEDAIGAKFVTIL